MTSVKTYFCNPIFTIWKVKDYKEHNFCEQFLSKNYFLEMPSSHAKMLLKSEPQKLNFVMTKAI